MTEREQELLKSMNELVKSMQEIQLVGQRAKEHYIEESDLDEILEITKKHV